MALQCVRSTYIVFVTGYTDPDTVARIRQQVPGASVLPKTAYRDRLAAAVASSGPAPSLKRNVGASLSTPMRDLEDHVCHFNEGGFCWLRKMEGCAHSEAKALV